MKAKLLKQGRAKSGPRKPRPIYRHDGSIRATSVIGGCIVSQVPMCAQDARRVARWLEQYAAWREAQG